MSVNLKGRKNAQSEQEVPAPELVMAGGQTPWATDAPPHVGNPFNEAPAATGMPTMPPPPPPGEEAEAEADAPSGRKAPSRNAIIALVAVVLLAGGGYYYTTMGSSDPKPTVAVKHVPLPGSPAAKAAAARAAAAAKAAAAKGGTAAKPAAGAAAGVVKPPAKPAVKPAPAKGGTVAKPATKPATKPAAKPAVKPVTPAVAPAVGTPFTAALPGRIGEWSKLVSTKVPDTLAKYDPDLGTTPSNVQRGSYGIGTSTYLSIVTGDHSANASKTAMQVLRKLIPELQADGFVVARPFAVAHTPYAGSAACTTLTVNDVLGVACVWMDSNTFGVIVAPHRAESQAKDILESVRGSVEH